MELYTAQELVNFESRIAATFDSAKIPHPIHLSDGNEEQLINIFREIESRDWVFSSWRSHYHALLKGVPMPEVEHGINSGHSIALNFPQHNFFSSAIVAGQIPIAVGTAMALKISNSDSKVWCFVGDMTSQTGMFRASIEYSMNFDLPVTFVVEDNNNSVCTDTRATWGSETLFYESIKSKHLISYRYFSKYPHAGAGKRVQF